MIRKLSVPYAGRYPSHGIRRGASQELQATGAQWPAVASIGCWGSLAFRGYVDHVARDLSNLLACDVSLETDDERDEMLD